MRLSISHKLLIYFYLLSFSAVIIISSYSYYKAREALISRTSEQLLSVRKEKKVRIEDFFQSVILDIDKITSNSGTQQILKDLNQIKSNPSDNQISFIYAFFRASKAYKTITFYHASKQYYSFNNDENDSLYENKSDQLYLNTYNQLWKEVQSKDIAIIDNFQNPKDGKIEILLAKKINQDKDSVIIICTIPIEAINHIMFDNHSINGLGNSGEAYLVGSDYLMRSSSRFHENSILKTKVNTIAVKTALQNIAATEIIADYRGKTVLSSFELINIPALKWVVLAEIDLSEVMISINLLRNSIIYLTIIISILMLGVVALLANAITQPIKILKKGAEKVSQGEYGETIDNKSKDEIGDLIVAFNEMTLKLKEQSEKLQHERKLRITSMIDGQELERQRLSRELHDSLGQSILAIKIKLELALNAEPSETTNIINDAQNLFSLTVQEIRNISNDLMPAVLNEFGLETALENMKKDMDNSINYNIILQSKLTNNRLDKKLETYIFRICQEALNNITKYAQATEVLISIEIIDENVIIEIDDNGIGFELNEHNLSKGNGLSNIKERVNLLNGSFKIVSQTNLGTKINILLPAKYFNPYPNDKNYTS